MDYLVGVVMGLAFILLLLFIVTLATKFVEDIKYFWASDQYTWCASITVIMLLVIAIGTMASIMIFQKIFT